MDNGGNGGGRSLALLLVIAILLLELILTKRASTIWAAIWSGPYPLGKASSAGGSSGGSSVTSQVIHLPPITIPNQPPY